jgi:hypothetical protein
MEIGTARFAAMYDFLPDMGNLNFTFDSVTPRHDAVLRAGVIDHSEEKAKEESAMPTLSSQRCLYH